MSTTKRKREDVASPFYAAFGLSAVALVAFSMVVLGCRLYPRGHAGATISWGQGGVFAGLLLGAALWPRLRGRRSAVGRMGSVFAVLFALAAAGEVFVHPDPTAAATPSAAFAAYLAAAGVLAGLALAGAYAGSLRPGTFVCVYLIGGIGAWAAVRGGSYPDDVTFALLGAAVPAALGSSLLSALYGRTVLRVASLAVLIASALPVGFDRIGLRLPNLWEISAQHASPSAAADLMWAQVIGTAALALLASSAFITGRHREEVLGLTRLHLMALLSGVASAILIWTILPSATSLRPVAWLAVSAFAGLVGADAWPVGRLSLDRAVLGILAAAAACMVLVWLPSSTASPYLNVVAVALFATVGLFLSLQFPTVAHTGMLVGPVHSLWLCASAALAATSVVGYLAQAPTAVLIRGLPSAAMGAIPALLFAAVASDIRLPHAWPTQARGWLRREWQAREVDGQAVVTAITVAPVADYSLWLRSLRLLTYLGYAPWWAVIGLLRGIWSALRMLVSTLVGIITGLTGGLLALALSRPHETTAQVVTVDERAPVIQLSPVGERRPDGGKPQHRESRLGHLLSLPILWVATGAQRLGNRLFRGRREPQETVLRVDETVPESEIITETIAVGPPPDVIPGPLDSDEIARAEALRRVFQNSFLHRWYRGSVGKVLARLRGTSLGPDAEEAWDERVFRCEMIGPRGRRFELSGHLWKSRRRCGCVVTVPILSGRSQKAVEVSTRHRQVRQMFEQDPDQLKRIMLRAAFRMAALDLSMGLASSRSVVCESPQDDLLEPHQDRQCELREEVLTGGHRCHMPLAQDAARGGTTLSACEGCNYPELWQRCASLDLKGTTGFNDDQDTLFRQAHLLCRLDGQVVDPEECPTRDCFSPSLMTRIISLDYKHTR
jgi:hypothetical protein